MWDVSITNGMLGANVHAVQGKQVRHQPYEVGIDQQTVAVPSYISKHCINVELNVGAMHVSNMPF